MDAREFKKRWGFYPLPRPLPAESAPPPLTRGDKITLAVVAVLLVVTIAVAIRAHQAWSAAVDADLEEIHAADRAESLRAVGLEWWLLERE